MNSAIFDQQYGTYCSAIEQMLDGLFTEEKPYETLYEAMRYSLLSGGKRLRPVLTLEFARLGGLDWRRALPFACALEMIHTYSLIHDDLPCMDDDALRRGKPTNHVVFGETMATLAGDALQPEAFRLLLGCDLCAEARAEGALTLAEACGADGMVAGQVLDLEHSCDDRATLERLNALKTGAMIRAAAVLGCIAAGADRELRLAADSYAKAIGLAFQIRDDMLDVIGDEQTFGKPIGSDREEDKKTFVDLLGIDGCQKEVDRLTKEAKKALPESGDTDFLRELADRLAIRKK